MVQRMSLESFRLCLAGDKDESPFDDTTHILLIFVIHPNTATSVLYYLSLV